MRKVAKRKAVLELNNNYLELSCVVVVKETFSTMIALGFILVLAIITFFV